MAHSPDPTALRLLVRKRLRRASQAIALLGGLGTVAVAAGLAAAQSPATGTASTPLASATPGGSARAMQPTLQSRAERRRKRRAHRLDPAAKATPTPSPTATPTPSPTPTPTPVAPAAGPPSSTSQGS